VTLWFARDASEHYADARAMLDGPGHVAPGVSVVEYNAAIRDGDRSRDAAIAAGVATGVGLAVTGVLAYLTNRGAAVGERHAQDGPSPSGRPPAGPAPERGPWYVTVAGGAGDARLTFIDGPTEQTRSLRDFLGDSPDTFAVDVGVGAQVSRTVLVGGHLAVFAAEATPGTASGDVHRSLRITSVAGVVTWFPFEHGPFVRAGAGPTSFVTRSEPYPGTPEARLSGMGVTVSGGVGYAVRVARRLDLTAAVDGSGHSFGSPEVGAPDTAMVWALRLGARWR
jgi:hypothetical protein